MHHDPQPDGSATTEPANTDSPATQPSKDATSRNQDARPVASGEAAVLQDQGGFVKLDAHGMVLCFVPL